MARALVFMTLSAGLLLLATSAPGASAGEPGGYVLSLEATREGCRLVSAAAIDSFTRQRHLPSDDDWTLELHTAEGTAIWRTRITHPWHVSPAPGRGQGASFAVRIPFLKGAAAATLSDHWNREVLVIPLDRSFADAADARRRRFTDHDRTNRELLALWHARKHGSISRPTGQPPRYEHFDDAVRQGLAASSALDIERLEHLRLRPLQALRRSGSLARTPAVDQAMDRLLAGDLRHKVGQSTTRVEHTLSGSVLDADSGAPVARARLYFYQYDYEWQYEGYLGSTTTDSSGRYSVSVDSGYVYAVFESPSAPLYAGQYALVMVHDDTALDLLVFPGVLLTGFVTDPEGNPVGGVVVRADNPRFYARSTSSTWSGYRIVAPRNQELTLSADPDPPYARPEPVDLSLTADGVHDLIIRTGDVVSGTVTDLHGTPIADAAVVLRHLADTTTASPACSTYTAGDGSFACALSRDLRPSSFLVSAHHDGHVRHTAGLIVDGDTVYDVRLDPGIRLTGVVVDGSGTAVEQAVIRVFQGEGLVTSATSEADGSYEVGLASGTYGFRVAPFNNEAPSPLAPAAMDGVEILESTTLDFTLQPAQSVVTVRLDYPSQEAFELSQGVVRIEVRQDDRPQLVTLDSSGAVYYDAVDATYYKETRLYLEDGVYDIGVYPMGADPFTLSGITATGSTSVRRTLSEPYRWSGVLRSSDGIALPARPVISYDEIAVQSSFQLTDQAGRFSVPLTPGGTLRFYSPEEGRSIRRVERIGPDAGDRQEDCVLDALPEVEDTAAVVTRIWGSGDPDERYNLVIIGDGYTDITETFTDLNRNGVWDGVLYYDLNRNGVYDGSPEQYTVYGAAQAPQVGSDPTEGNEPFTDINGDGFPNLDDQATYDENSLALIRSLFGSDVWRHMGDVFNVYRIRVISEQAGHDILDESYELFLDRDTALNTYIYDPDRRYILAADDGMVQQYVNRYTAFADTLVVLVNQPVQIGRATSYIITRGGPAAYNANYYVMSHEMGHNVGLLADEYVEFPETYEGPELLRPNITTAAERDLVPWRDLIAPDKEVPSTPLTTGVGVFEGAYYRPGGVYRPVERCTMRGSERFCPVCTREIIYRGASLAERIPDEVLLIAPLGNISTFTPTFEWSGPVEASHYRFELRAAGEDSPSESLDVYATTFELGRALPPGAAHQWRVRPAVEHHWGSWSEWAGFVTAMPDPRTGGQRLRP